MVSPAFMELVQMRILIAHKKARGVIYYVIDLVFLDNLPNPSRLEYPESANKLLYHPPTDNESDTLDSSFDLSYSDDSE